jgi:hypothetical protein
MTATTANTASAIMDLITLVETISQRLDEGNVGENEI